MSLRARIVAAIALVLILGSGLGLALAGWHARQWLREELTSAQMSGELAVKRAYADTPPADARSADLRPLIATFDGNRHLQAANSARWRLSRSRWPTRPARRSFPMRVLIDGR